MSNVLGSVLAVAALLILVSLQVPLAARLRMPLAVLLAVLGLALGFVGLAFAESKNLGIAGDVMRSLGHLGLGAEGMLAVFLPPLLFVAGLTVDVRRLLDEAAAVLLLAVVAVIVCAVVVGYALAIAVGIDPLVGLLVGAVIATTDPAAVVAVFRDLGAPHRLSILVEGESLLNDAAAIALFSLLIGVLTGKAEADLGHAGLDFMIEFGGGAVAGFVIARAVCGFIPYLGGSLMAEMTVTVALAYLAYGIADVYLGVSGVVAVAAASLTMAVYGPLRMSPASWRGVLDIWPQIEFWASSLIFVLAAMLAARVLSSADPNEIVPVLVVAAAALIARAATLYGLLPGLSGLGLVEQVEGRYRKVILWGGLRGAVTMVLALAVSENPALPESVRHLVATLAIGFVLFTLFVQAPTLRPLMALLGIDRLDPVESALRDRVAALSRANVAEQLAEVARSLHLDPAATERRFRKDAAADATLESGDALLTEEVRLKVGLITLAGRERELYLRHFSEHSISRRLAAMLIAHAGRIADRAKTGGLAGYREAAGRAIGFGPRFQFALWMQRRFRSSGMLAARLADRFEILLIQQLVLDEVITFAERSVAPILGERTAGALADLAQERREAVRQASAALALQYPAYAAALGERHLVRAELRLEEAEYVRKHAETLISTDVFEALRERIRERRRAIEQRPSLDLGLQLTEMIRRVPMLAALDSERLAEIARQLCPLLALPGERVVARGEKGDAMYFIVAGELEVRLPGGPVRLAAGDFFGELALLNAAPRVADVVANGYSQLLALKAADFRRLLRAAPEVQAAIAAVARERSAATGGNSHPVR